MNPWRGLEGLPRDVWIQCAAALVNRTGTMVLPFLVLYLTRERSFDMSTAGAMRSLYAVVSIAAVPIAGRLTDRYGPALVMKMSLVLSGVVLLLFPMARGLVAVAACVSAFSIASRIYGPAALTLISRNAPRDQRKAALSLNRVANNLGGSIGPAVGGFLAGISFFWLFVADGVTSLLAAPVLLLLNPEPPGPPAPSRASARGVLGDRRFLVFLAAGLPILVAFAQVESTLPLYIVLVLKLSERVFGLLFALNTVLIVLFEVPLNLRMARWKHSHALALGCVLSAAGFGAMVLAHGIAGLAASIAVWTFGEMILLPALTDWIAERSPEGRQGSYMAAHSLTLNGVAFGIGPWVGALVLEKAGGPVLWTAALSLAALSALALGIVARPAATRA